MLRTLKLNNKYRKMKKTSIGIELTSVADPITIKKISLFSNFCC